MTTIKFITLGFELKIRNNFWRQFWLFWHSLQSCNIQCINLIKQRSFYLPEMLRRWREIIILRIQITNKSFWPRRLLISSSVYSFILLFSICSWLVRLFHIYQFRMSFFFQNIQRSLNKWTEKIRAINLSFTLGLTECELRYEEVSKTIQKTKETKNKTWNGQNRRDNDIYNNRKLLWHSVADRMKERYFENLNNRP